MGGRALLVAALAALLLGARNHPAPRASSTTTSLPKQEQAPTGATNPKPEADQDNCGKPCFVLNQHIGPSAHKSEPQQQKDYGKANLIVNRRLVCATWVLVCIGFIVGFLQSVILWKQVTTARVLQRPWLIMQSAGPPIGWPLSLAAISETPSAISLKWTLSNDGKTPAWVTEIGIQFEVRDWPLPDTPIPVATEPAYDLAVTKRKTHSLETSPPVAVPDGDWQLIGQGRKCATFYGIVRYKDSFDRRYVTRFCETWRFVPVMAPTRDGRLGLVAIRKEDRPCGPTPAWTEHT